MSRSKLHSKLNQKRQYLRFHQKSIMHLFCQNLVFFFKVLLSSQCASVMLAYCLVLITLLIVDQQSIDKIVCLCVCVYMVFHFIMCIVFFSQCGHPLYLKQWSKEEVHIQTSKQKFHLKTSNIAKIISKHNAINYNYISKLINHKE